MLLCDFFLVFLSCHLLLSVLVSIEQQNHLCHCPKLLYQLWDGWQRPLEHCLGECLVDYDIEQLLDSLRQAEHR
jgi:hypothetical protein